jgi:hypothetical protein
VFGKLRESLKVSLFWCFSVTTFGGWRIFLPGGVVQIVQPVKKTTRSYA